MRDLSSKLIAGGLSAGAILLWWPTLFATEGLLSWTVRGVVWTLMFELLLLALLPLERAFWNETRPGQKVANRAAGAKNRVLDQPSPRRRVASMALVAAFVLAIPVSLIVNGPPKSPTQANREQKQIVHVTKVVRVIERGHTKTVYIPARQGTKNEANLRRPTPIGRERNESKPKPEPTQPRRESTAPETGEEGGSEEPSSEPVAPEPQ